MVLSGEVTLSDLTKSIEKISTVSGTDIRAVLYALIDVMKVSLSDGKIIRIGELGSLRANFSSNGEALEEDVKATTIRRSKVMFSPGKELREMLTLMEYKKA